MEFGWTSDQEALRGKLQAFLDASLPADWETIASLSPGSQAVTDFSREFCPQLAEAGMLCSHWPEEHGGSDASAWDHFIIGELLWGAGEPRGPQYYNVNWIGPTILAYGTEEQKAQHLARMREGNVVWCQGFSEPSGGSDLAAIRTRAVRQPGGDGRYLVNGQKIWTSYARLAEFCFLVVKTGDARRDVSVFLLPMDRPGITVRPIDSVVGDGDLHEVFFDDVEVFEAERLGPEGKGWEVIRYSLDFERVGIPRYALALRTLHRAVAELQREGSFIAEAEQDAALALARCEAARMLVYETVDKRMRERPDTGSASMARYAVVCAERQVADFVLDWTPHLFTSDDAPMVATHHKRAIAAGLAAGAAEIQLNLVARDVLGLGV
ncbi:MAG: acyl-CoA dehydrogenase family protein [Novosphingobium sp.]|nr:acyl-CoA dehydrogenase family protein [Novosphingobium sp.]MCP5403159.1 acyl-CoA dehydrogenase family protein [Novosphingobium sp.]